METHWIARRCITTTRSFRSTTEKKISLRVCRLMGEGKKQSRAAEKQHPISAAARHKKAAHGASRGKGQGTDQAPTGRKNDHNRHFAFASNWISERNVLISPTLSKRPSGV